MNDSNNNYEWWQSEYEFFGKFYHTGDNSVEGYDANNKLSRPQRTERELRFIEKYLSPQIGDKILDCPCGSGRHTIQLANRNFDAIGVDINDEMLSFHKEFIDEANQKLPLFKKMDMRALMFEDCSFHFVVNVFLSFGFFKSDIENEKVIREFFRVLKPGGKVMIHLDMNYDRVIQGIYFGEENITRECSANGDRKTLEVIEHYNPETKRLYGVWKLLNGDEKVKHYDLRIYDNHDELIPLFLNNGFRSVVLIDPDRPVFDINSKETIIVATK